MASLGKTDNASGSASDSALGYSTLESGAGNVILTSADALLGWSRGQSLWAFPMGTACCAMELIAASFSKFDFDRLGVFPRQGPRHTDVMIVAGTITEKMKPVVIRLYEQMAEPKWVIAMGNCAISGGIFYYDTYSVVRGVDQFLPVDVYIAGCPPRPESLQDGIVQLRNLVRAESLSPRVRYRRQTEIPLRTAPAPAEPAPTAPASAEPAPTAPASAPSKDPL